MTHTYKLSDVFDLQMGKTPSRDIKEYWQDGEYEWISIADLTKSGKYICETKEKISQLAVEESGIRRIPSNTVIMSFKLSIGKVAITKKSIFSNEAIMAFIDKGVVSILPQYAYYLFSAQTWDKGVNRAVMGTTLNKATLSQYRISLHDKEIQLEIVEKLDKISELIAARKEQLCKVDDLVKSQFIEMFEKREFDVLFFGDLCEFLRNGANIKQSKGAGGYPITRIETLSNDVFNANRLGYADITDLDRYQGYLLHEGDILISHINSIAYLGRAVQYRGELDLPVIHGMNLLCARLKKSVLPDYIEAYFRTKKAKEYISTITKKAVNQASITITDLKKMKVPVPPIELQSEFAHFVEQTDKSKVPFELEVAA